MRKNRNGWNGNGMRGNAGSGTFMERTLYYGRRAVRKCEGLWIRLKYEGTKTDQGIDGILVTVGLCIIALLLCVVMKDSLTDFIKTIVKSMTTEASKILQGTRV